MIKPLPCSKIQINQLTDSISIELGRLYFIEHPYYANNKGDFSYSQVLIGMPVVIIEEKNYILFLTLCIPTEECNLRIDNIDYKTESVYVRNIKSLSKGIIEMDQLEYIFKNIHKSGGVTLNFDNASVYFNSLWMSCTKENIASMIITPTRTRFTDVRDWPYMAVLFWCKNHLYISNDDIQSIPLRSGWLDANEEMENIWKIFSSKVYDYNKFVNDTINKEIQDQKSELTSIAKKAAESAHMYLHHNYANSGQIIYNDAGHYDVAVRYNSFFEATSSLKFLGIHFKAHGDDKMYFMRLLKSSTIAGEYSLQFESTYFRDTDGNILEDVSDYEDNDIDSLDKYKYIHFVVESPHSMPDEDHIGVFHIGDRHIHILKRSREHLALDDITATNNHYKDYIVICHNDVAISKSRSKASHMGEISNGESSSQVQRCIAFICATKYNLTDIAKELTKGSSCRIYQSYESYNISIAIKKQLRSDTIVLATSINGRSKDVNTNMFSKSQPGDMFVVECMYGDSPIYLHIRYAFSASKITMLYGTTPQERGLNSLTKVDHKVDYMEMYTPHSVHEWPSISGSYPGYEIKYNTAKKPIAEENIQVTTLENTDTTEDEPHEEHEEVDQE